MQSCTSWTDINKSEIFNSVEPQVRVRIINTSDTVQIRFLDDWNGYLNDSLSNEFSNDELINIMIFDDRISFSKSGSSDVITCDLLILKSLGKAGELEIKNVAYGVGWWWAGSEDRTYEGGISVYPSESGTLEVIVTLPLEDYLCGVVPYEIGGDSPLEALKAQAVAARSEAAIALSSDLYGGTHHDLTSDVECQVFSGNNKRTHRSDKAVFETRGLILSNQGQPINAYYASNCGGYSELIANVWPERPALETYLHAGKDSDGRPVPDLNTEDKVRNWIFSQPDVFCNPHLETELPDWSQKNFRWQKKFTTDSLTKMISGNRDIGKLLNIKALKRGLSGRMCRTRFIFEQDSFEVTGELAIRQLWHPALRSACFIVDQEGDDFILTGAGWGHGVGMCQTGAVAQAIRGSDFKSILKHYYQKADIISIYK